MKKIFFILIILSFMAFNSFANQGILSDTQLKQACEAINPHTKIKFYTSYGKLTYNNTYSREHLSRLGKNLGMFEEGELASGLALVDIASEYELSTSSRKMINNGVCIIPQELSIYIGFQNPVIYLASDLQKDSCLYNLVVRHEQVHQQINVNALEYFIPIIYKKVKNITSNMHPMYVTSEQHIKSGTNDMTNFYAQQINNLVEEFKQEILTEQRKLDNHQQYQLESNICQTYNTKKQH